MLPRPRVWSWRAVAAFAATSSFSVASSASDRLEGTRGTLDERPAAVDLRLERGHATMVVTRIIQNPGTETDQATYGIDLPVGGVAIRLRSGGVGPRGEAIWFEGELMEASRAAARYSDLTGYGAAPVSKDPALLAWRSLGGLTLQVFPVPAGGTKTVEYTVRAPMSYDKGRWGLHLPLPSSPAAEVRLTSVAGDDLDVDGVPVRSGTKLVATDDLDVHLTPRGARPTLDGALAAIPLSPSRFLVHGRIAAAPRLVEPPAHAAVAILLDTSRSMAGELDASLAAARAYLSHLPSAEVEVLTFDRKVASPFGGSLPVAEALRRLDGFRPVLANGSRLDLALAAADARLAAATTRVRRILLLTDLRTREILTPRQMGTGTAGLASGAVLHVATVTDGAPSVARDDASEWAKVPRSTGGLLWRATIDDSDDARAPFEEWVRPMRIERVTLLGAGEVGDEPLELREGEEIVHETIATRPISGLTIRGELWSRPFERSFAVSADESLRWSALVFGSPLAFQLSDAEQMKVALLGRAVSPVTSYLAIEPGVRPSADGLEPGISVSGSSTSCHGYRSRAGSHSVAPTFDRSAFLTRALNDALARCHAKTSEATVTVETTLSEIVDVREVTTTRSRDATVEACVGEELWHVELPSGFAEPHTTFSLAVKTGG